MIILTILRAISHAIADANRRKAEREIARFISRNGGMLTDSTERQIGRITVLYR